MHISNKFTTFVTMKRYSKKGLEKRKKERKDFPEFFKRHIEIIKSSRICCEECGAPLKGDVSEVAHILSKSYFKSISTNDNNILYLCSWKSERNCHAKFDNGSNEEVHEMKIFDKVSERFLELEQEITEKISWKVTDKYIK